MKKKNKKVILVDDKEQRNKNIDEFVENFIKENKDLMDRLADGEEGE